MWRNRWTGQAIFLLLLMQLYGGCNGDIVKIGEIVSSPQTYIGKEVKVKGRVDRTFDLFIGSVFRVKDNTGFIWVRSKVSIPKQDERIVVKGKVEYISDWIIPGSSSESLGNAIVGISEGTFSDDDNSNNSSGVVRDNTSPGGRIIVTTRDGNTVRFRNITVKWNFTIRTSTGIIEVPWHLEGIRKLEVLDVYNVNAGWGFTQEVKVRIKFESGKVIDGIIPFAV